MKLTVFGATGRIGGQVVRQALDAGHEVTAVVRDPARLAVRDPALAVATVPDLADLDAVRAALQGREATISAIGPRGRKDGPVASRATHHILRALDASGVSRLLVVSAVPVGPVPAGESLVNRRLLLPFIRALLRDAYADLAAMEDELRGSATVWTVVRPPRLVDRPRSATYRTVVGANVPRAYSASRADVAHALLAAVDDPATFRRPVGVAS